ncbi:MAG: glyceraldehyde 3-phosphate dehydrogenase NAD-binding domain-containing protein, partial [Actinomycetota bacterium]
MTTRIGINGFGRIGRNFFRAILGNDEADIEVAAVNDLSAPDILAHLLKYDSTHGILDAEIKAGDDGLSVNGTSFRVVSERDPSALPWGDLGVEVVVECTGLFTDRESADKHRAAGAKKVIFSAPASSAEDADLTVVLGVNEDRYDPKAHHVISNGSCTTNCVVPMAKVLM